MRHVKVIIDSYRGRVARAKQNRDAYAARCGGYPSPFPLKIPGLPSDLIAYARRPCRIGGAVIEEYELGLWQPPYKLDVPQRFNDQPTQADLFDSNEGKLPVLEGALNSYQFQRFIEAGYTRYDRWIKEAEVAFVIEEIQIEIRLRVAAWQNAVAEQSVGVRASPRADVVHRVGLEWGARVICALLMEVEICKDGVDGYCMAFKTGNLPWQHLNVRDVQ